MARKVKQVQHSDAWREGFNDAQEQRHGWTEYRMVSGRLTFENPIEHGPNEYPSDSLLCDTACSVADMYCPGRYDGGDTFNINDFDELRGDYLVGFAAGWVAETE